MIFSRKNLRLVIQSIIMISSMTSCLPQQASTAGTSRRTITAGQSTGADSNSQTNSNNQSGSQSGPIATTNSNQSGQSGQSGNDTCYKADAFICKIERMVTEKTNKYRASRGLQPLKLDSKISFVARDWSQKQSNKGFIGHMGFPSARQSVYQTEFNERRSLNGENVAYTGMLGRSNQQDDAAAERVAEEFAVMWWNSPGHRRNMLGDFSNIGVGITQRNGGDWYATQIFN